jgi:hypothetical protein
MRKNLLGIAILSVFSLQGCFLEKMYEANLHVEKTIHADWEKYVPLDELVKGIEECNSFPEIVGCGKLNDQVYDIAIAYTTCQSQAIKSKLCEGVIKTISDDPIKKLLPDAQALTLPDNPFYIRLPTLTLDSISSRYGYRSEVFVFWINKNRSNFLMITLLMTIILAIWLGFKFHKVSNENRVKDERKKIDQEQEVVKQKVLDEELLIRDVAIAEEHKAAGEKIAAQKKLHEIEQKNNDLKIAAQKLAAQEAEAKKAADKKIIEDILNAFKNPPHKK